MMKIILLVLLLCGCASKEKEILYSNMAGKESINEVREALAQRKVSSSHITTYLDWVEDLNNRVATPLQDEFVPMNSSKVSYANFVYQSTDFLEVNARVASYVLFQDCVSSKLDTYYEDSLLLDDLSFLENSLSMKDKQIDTYIALYQTIPLDSATSISEHITCIMEQMENSKVEFHNQNKFTLIRVYAHNPIKNVRYVEHAGIVIEKNKDLLFLEKYGLSYPFQATKFDNRVQLIHYLLQREPKYISDKVLAPIIFENDLVLDITE